MIVVTPVNLCCDVTQEAYTRVLIGSIDLATTVWPRGMYGKYVSSHSTHIVKVHPCVLPYVEHEHWNTIMSMEHCKMVSQYVYVCGHTRDL